MRNLIPTIIYWRGGTSKNEAGMGLDEIEEVEEAMETTRDNEVWPNFTKRDNDMVLVDTKIHSEI